MKGIGETMINEEVRCNENLIENRESLSSRLAKYNNIGVDQLDELISKFASQPLKKVFLSKKGYFDSGFVDIIAEYLDIHDLDYNSCTMQEFLDLFERYLYAIRSDPEYGVSEAESCYLPVFLLMRFLFNSISYNSVVKRLFSVNYEVFVDYIRVKCFHPEASEKDIPEDLTKNQKVKTLKDFLDESLASCVNYWTPGEDIRGYIMKMRVAYSSLYMCVYYPMVSTILKLAKSDTD